MYINFLWSKGIFYRSRYMLIKNSTNSNENNILSLILNNNQIIWIRNNVKNIKEKDLDYFAKHINLLKKDVILITGDSDLSVPSCYSNKTVFTILNNKYVKKWYTQNYDRSILHHKLSYYPIGLDLHTSRWLISNSKMEKIRYMIKVRFMNNDIILNKVFCDSHLRLTSNERIIMHKELENNRRIIFLEKLLGFNKIILRYKIHKFVISPAGNGLDCHRTWELLLLGCIVITKTSSLDEMWINNNLPVVILNNWSDLNNDLKTKLKIWYNKYNEFTNFDYIFPKFKISYWIDLNLINKNCILNYEEDSNIMIENLEKDNTNENNDELYLNKEKINFIEDSQDKNDINQFIEDKEYIDINININSYKIENYIDIINNPNNLITK